ncbi:hypothetical protein NUW58_g9940 [Xylaria curta]|uniref:Uncharacterized protein n=1 Tax=Xylaria curta TaxID=42375 RepID=A0ACC1MSI1_9PEZI|nr:hypothetical protein NUW58_g9940 [Xylaria curta]
MPSNHPAPPGGFQPPDDKPFIYGNHNPDQEIKSNLAAAAATRVVGGMSTHWSCCTPRQYANASLHHNERSDLFSPDEWEGLYKDCEKIFSTDTTGKVFADSVRQRLVMKKLKEAFDEDFRKGVKKDGQKAARQVSPMPLACKQTADNKAYIEWTCTASILEKLAEPNTSPNFTLMSQAQCDMLKIDAAGQKVEWASIVDLVSNEEYTVTAKKYIICGGATLTAGIMAKFVFKSELALDTFCPALGKYLTEQTMSFCQVVLKQGFVDEVINTPEHLDKPEDTPEQKSSTKVIEHKKQHPEDPVPFPFEDFDPQVYTPYSEDYPWHTQIHRDAFGYGELPSNIDPRLVVDLRFFAQVEAVATNYISWKLGSTDAFAHIPFQAVAQGQRTSPRDDDRASSNSPPPIPISSISIPYPSNPWTQTRSMTHVASLLGDYIPGAEPQHLAPGLALHICGVYRAGKTDNKEESVVDRAGKSGA